MITFTGFGHINIVVDDIDKATAFYRESLGAIPVQEARHFKNLGFARAAGFLANPELVEVSIRFLALPVPDPLFLELMCYHAPKGSDGVPNFQTHDQGLRHISLRVENVAEAFEHVRQCPGMRLISESPDYRPYKLDEIRPEQFRLFDPQIEENPIRKEELARSASSTCFFYALDPYGVQWEFEQRTG